MTATKTPLTPIEVVSHGNEPATGEASEAVSTRGWLPPPVAHPLDRDHGGVGTQDHVVPVEPGGSYASVDTQEANALPHTITDAADRDQMRIDTHTTSVPTEQGEGHPPADTHRFSALSHTIAEIREYARLLDDLIRAEVRLTLQIGAIRCRVICGALKIGDKHKCGRKGRYGVRPNQDGDGQAQDDTQCAAAVPLNGRGQSLIVARDNDAPASGEGGHEGLVNQPVTGPLPANTPTFDTATLELMATVASDQLAQARVPLRYGRRDYERRLAKLAVLLPVYPWVAGVRGFGELSLARIVGETGDLADYANPAKVWKRMGLAVVAGGRQRRVTGAEALEHGYVSRRRAVMWVIGESLIKGNKDGPYYRYYAEEKERQREQHPDLTDQHTHNRAKRAMEKRLLRDLWRAWNGETGRMAP